MLAIKHKGKKQMAAKFKKKIYSAKVTNGLKILAKSLRYPRGIDVSNFMWKFEYFVPEERFFGGGVQIWQPFVSYLYV
jgi:hypothetical protein